MVQIDNVKMWESLIRISKEGDNLIGDREIGLALKDQGLEYKDGEIVSKEKIKGNQRKVSPNPSELSEFEKAIALLIFNSQNTCNSIKVCEEQARKESKALLTFASQQIASEIDADAMVEYFIENLPAYTVIHESVDKRLWGEPYKKGIKDTIKKIKED